MIENLKWVKERGRKLGIIGTPNFFVGDKLIKSVADDGRNPHTRRAGRSRQGCRSSAVKR